MAEERGEASTGAAGGDVRPPDLETLVSNLPGVVYRCTNEPGWPMEFVGGECERLTGYEAAAIEAGEVSWGEDVIVERDRQSVWDSVQASVEAGEPFEFTYRIGTADGERKWVWERGRGVDGGAALEGFITDVTDRVEQRRGLERENERLATFASVLSHDLRNPLNVATGTLEEARERRDGDQLREATIALERIDTLVDDLLTLTRRGEALDDREPVDVDRLARRCWTSVETADATIAVETDRTLRADRSRLAQVFENLFRNAVEHGSRSPRSDARGDAAEHAGDEVAITVGEHPDGVYVADDGPGVPPDEREAVFETGYSTDDVGSGLGLSIVQDVVEAHGWDIRVTESDGGGARFEICTDGA